MLTVSENELFRFCLSLLLLHLRVPASLSLQFLSAALFFTLIFQCIAFVSFFLLDSSLDSLCLRPSLSSLPPSVILLWSFSLYLIFPLLHAWAPSFSPGCSFFSTGGTICSALFCDLTGYRLLLRR